MAALYLSRAHERSDQATRKRDIMTHTRRTPGAHARTLAGLTLAGTLLAAAAYAGPTAAPGYTLTTFGATPAGFTGPDSLAVLGGNVFVGYGDQGGKAGGGTSTVAEFSGAGTLLNTFTLAGHNDGLKVDPSTGLLYALQNEDGNPALSIINTSTKTGDIQNFSLNAVNGGGYDDIVFQNGHTYLSASNASKDPNTDPAIVEATRTANGFTFAPVLQGNAAANGGAATLNLTDADSLTTTPNGSLLLTDQTANQLITVSNQGTPFQTVSAIGTSYNGTSRPVDDTVFTSGAGTLLVSDTAANAVYALHGPFTGGVFSAANDAGIVGALDPTTGDLTAVATGLGAPHGLAFLPAAPVPEASTTVSLGLLLALGLGGTLVSARRKKANA